MQLMCPEDEQGLVAMKRRVWIHGSGNTIKKAKNSLMYLWTTFVSLLYSLTTSFAFMCAAFIHFCFVRVLLLLLVDSFVWVVCYPFISSLFLICQAEASG